MQVIPSLLTYNLNEFSSQFENLKKYYNRFQIDIADGKYVPNTTLQIEDIAPIIASSGVTDESEDAKSFATWDAAIRQLAESGGNPVEQEEFASSSPKTNKRQIPPLSLDFHLMVKDFTAEIEKLKQLKNTPIGTIFIHASLSPNYDLLTKTYPQFSFGLVLNPEDSVKTIGSNYDLNKIENIQIMTIVPGFQGNSFIPETLNKIEQLRTANYKSSIFLDGSISNKTIPQILEQKYQPDFLCVGSYLSRAENVEERVEYLLQLLYGRSGNSQKNI